MDFKGLGNRLYIAGVDKREAEYKSEVEIRVTGLDVKWQHKAGTLAWREQTVGKGRRSCQRDRLRGLRPCGSELGWRC